MNFLFIEFVLISFSVLFPEVDDERSPALQAGFQILGLVVTLFIAIVTGAVTGKAHKFV